MDRTIVLEITDCGMTEGSCSHPKGMHHSGDILPADRALWQLPATFDTSEHVPALQKNAVHRSIHAYLAEIGGFCI